MTTRSPKQDRQPAQKSSKARGVEQVPCTGALQAIALNQLHPSPLNVRKTGGQKTEDLAASIAAEGLIHNLTVVRVAGKKLPRYEVIAGGRRLRALQQLVKQKVIPADQPIACRIVGADRGTGTSLAENIIREAMHPADQFDAFRQLVDEGRTQTEIAARFGVTSAVIRDRLALARVAPEVLALYRTDGLTLDQVMAFTVSTDHEQHRALLANKRLPSAWDIKRQLLAGAVSGSDRRAVFVGQKAYVAAGGKVRKDLFAGANDEGTYFEDAALLERLAVEKLEVEAERLREAWAWVDVRTELGYDERSKYGSVPTVTGTATAEQAAQLQSLDDARTAARAALDAFEEQPESGDDEADSAAWQALDTAVEAAERAWSDAHDALDQTDPNAAAYAGAIVTLSHAGTVQMHTGLVRPEDKAQLSAGIRQAGGHATASTAATGATDPLPVRMGLSALRTAVAQEALAENIDAALRMLAFALVQTTIRVTRSGGGYGLNVRGADKTDLNGACEGLAATAIGQRHAERAAAWASDLPDDDAALWAWCLAADDHTICSLLAYCTARTLDGVQRFPASRDELGPVARALGIDMADHWQPTAGYFAKVKKSDTLAALAGEDGKAPVELTKLKRDQLAEEAAKRLAGSRWLPPTLRNVA
jgi:ParB family chromosome partitioning protein